eukprot:m.122193 g.122193  ORF g.122193 m.122193 type:complete len:509 (-) comp9624_c1_seq1:36-1562(-)
MPPRNAKRRRRNSDGAAKEASAKLLALPDAQLMEEVLFPGGLASFLSNSWEKAPRVQRALSPQHAALAQRLFSLAALRDIVDSDSEAFQLGTTINAMRYDNHVKRSFAPNDDFEPGVAALDRLLEQGSSFQFHQPQRHIEPLQRILRAMERVFGSLCGANVYITPPGAQGLAPHHDDIEAFVLQVEGRKKWKLYKPKQELALTYSDDLDRSSLGAPILEVTLNAGDVLYFPRGTIHEACTGEDALSTHVTFSTYQDSNWSSVLSGALSRAVCNLAKDDLELRRGLPLCFSQSVGAMFEQCPEHAKGRELLRERLAALLQRPDFLDRAVDAAVEELDEMGADFVSNRLPHVPGALDVPPEEGFVRLMDPTYLRILPSRTAAEYDEEEPTEDQADEAEESGNSYPDGFFYIPRDNHIRGRVAAVDGRFNPAEDHMLREGAPRQLTLPPAGLAIVRHLAAAYPDAVAIEELQRVAGLSGASCPEELMPLLETMHAVCVKPDEEDEEDEEDV